MASDNAVFVFHMIAWLQQFLLPGYWFWFTPKVLSRPMFIALAAVFGAFIAASIVIRAAAARKRGSLYWKEGAPRVASPLLWTGLLGLLYVWFRQEQIYFFSARFWLAALAAVFAVWMGLAVRRIAKDIPKRAAEFAEKARIEKYLPKK